MADELANLPVNTVGNRHATPELPPTSNAGKILMAIEAFVIDLILVQDTDSREDFFPYTVVHQAKELRKITDILGAQLLVIEDNDRVQDTRALYGMCRPFRFLREHMVPPSSGADLAPAA